MFFISPKQHNTKMSINKKGGIRSGIYLLQAAIRFRIIKHTEWKPQNTRNENPETLEKSRTFELCG
jgi:hypothetical protein